jgi:tripartite-type tricarboxylate transporter receptor subunit TctC
VLQRLETELHKAMATPAMKERVAMMGATPGVPSAAAFTQVIQSEIKRWAPNPAAGTAAAAVMTAVALKP